MSEVSDAELYGDGRRGDGSATKNVLNVTRSDVVYGRVSGSELTSLCFAASGSGGLPDIIALRKRIHECIHAYALCGTPLTLARLNRYFARAASAHGTSVRACVQLLEDRGLAVLLESQVRVLLTASVWEETKQLAVDLDASIEELRTGLIANAVL